MASVRAFSVKLILNSILKGRFILIFAIFLFSPLLLQAQKSTNTAEGGNVPRVIQFSGLVVNGDSLYGVPGVSVYVPLAGRGAITSSVGYFSFPLLVGDSVLIRTIGFKDKSFVIPDIEDDRLSVIIELMEDTLLFPVVEIFPYPTEKLFKEAFIALKMPHTDMDNMHKNLNEQVTKRMLYTMGQDGAMNHKYYMEQQVIRQENKMMAYPTFNFLNPFAWSKFIQSIKKGEHKNKSKDYDYETED
jgi:hypothetical protein